MSSLRISLSCLHPSESWGAFMTTVKNKIVKLSRPPYINKGVAMLGYGETVALAFLITGIVSVLFILIFRPLFQRPLDKDELESVERLYRFNSYNDISEIRRRTNRR